MRKLVYVVVFALMSNTITAQDVIIKTDHTEVLTKVLEVTENEIKYKYWDRQDGPTYNLKKEDIFLIVYKSGVKEHYGRATPTSEVATGIASSSPAPSEKPTAQLINVAANATSEPTVSSTENTEERPSYPAMGKLNFGFGKTTTEDFSTYGFGGIASMPFSKYGTNGPEFELGSFSLFSNLDTAFAETKSNTYVVSGAVNYGIFLVRGLKISAGVGYYYGWGDTTVSTQTGESTASITVNDLFYNGTLEYLFTKGFGLNVRYDEVLGLNFGISFAY